MQKPNSASPCRTLLAKSMHIIASGSTLHNRDFWWSAAAFAEGLCSVRGAVDGAVAAPEKRLARGREDVEARYRSTDLAEL